MDRSNLPWSIKGITPEARQAAKERAAEAGQPMGAWLSEAIHSVSRAERAAAGGGPSTAHPVVDSQGGGKPASAIHGALEDETTRPYDTAGLASGLGGNVGAEMTILAQRIAKVERWTARSVAHLRHAIEEITRRLEALERPSRQPGDYDRPHDPNAPLARRRWRR